MDKKDRWILLLSIGLIVMFGIALLNKYDLQNYKKEIERKKGNSPWLWCLDKDNYGIGGRTDWSVKGFKATCESDFFDLNCSWVKENVEGCRCYVR